ncbi:MAG: hypothetical protein LVQ97_04615 [Candidatus Micrarchaeales archaeon]|jgi:hypothetical protein|uniref:Uncharacterized protein n=1 Tax=Candidatus Micrarchaeum acidiphilum ARMAN-2 TaxID=425595 RepID=C7DH02_MICA2|nr:MAG: hypothetical protein UNLARM2_0348 [Candidatus Micrarchaeum acidiphilum ARMAN-2]MCW6161440.1 hypothetical protein [Candidatus Micrarchaeales archaeon]
MTKQKTNSDGITRRIFTKEVVKLRESYNGKVSEEEMKSIGAILETVDATFIGTSRYSKPENGYDLIASSIYAAAVQAKMNGHDNLWKDLASVENSDSLINKFSRFVKSDAAIVEQRKKKFDKLQYLREVENTPGGLASILSSEKGRADLLKQLRRIEKES